MSETILTVKNLSKSFDSVKALDGASIEVHENKLNLLIGANGSGKTSLINAVSGVTGSDSGQIIYRSEDITHHAPHEVFQSGIARTFQQPRLFANLSVLENLLVVDCSNDRFSRAFYAREHRDAESKARQKALAMLESLDLLPHRDKLAYDMSGGQIKLLELGKTLMSDAPMILLDEPIAGVNPVLAHKIFARIRGTKDTTFLIIEHRLDIALKYADYVYVMDKGRIIAQDDPDKILLHEAVRESYLK